MIEIQGLKKAFPGGTQAVRGVDLRVEQGELLALLGPNGAGKTTTIRACTTLSGFDHGRITVAGHDVDRAPDKVRQAIGYVAQSTGVDYFLTGRENLVLQGRLYHLPRREILARVEALARQFELSDALDRPVSQYSGGMQRKLDIATALIHRPRVLFLDEPTLGLDTASRHALWALIRRLNQEEGLTILLTTHYLEEADDLAQRVAIMHQGEIKVVDRPEALKAQLGGDAVTLEFAAGDARAWLQAQWEALAIRHQVWEGERLHLYLPDGAQAIPRILESARAHGLEVRAIGLARPTLDDVFLRYTGASLKGGEEDGAEPWWAKWAGKGGGAWQKRWQAQQEDDASSDTDDWRRWQQAQGGDPSDRTQPTGGEPPWQQWQQQAQDDSTSPDSQSNEAPRGQTWPQPQDGEAASDRAQATGDEAPWQRWQQQAQADDERPRTDSEDGREGDQGGKR